ncbi:MAG: helix-turn-helix domain-containing protein [Verrucomicrobiae bacterium]|nr:helix-turn-helix domain-containing protein [Verrucomicrobiae bacterium]
MKYNQPNTSPSDLLTRSEAAAYLRISVRSIDRNSSPHYLGHKPLKKRKVGGLVRYRRKDLDDFLE